MLYGYQCLNLRNLGDLSVNGCCTAMLSPWAVTAVTDTVYWVKGCRSTIWRLVPVTVTVFCEWYGRTTLLLVLYWTCRRQLKGQYSAWILTSNWYCMPHKTDMLLGPLTLLILPTLYIYVSSWLHVRCVLYVPHSTLSHPGLVFKEMHTCKCMYVRVYACMHACVRTPPTPKKAHQ